MMKATGKDFYRFNLKLGFKRIIVGVDYIRYYEYPLVFNNLAISKNIRILDVGCGTSLFPLFLAYHGCNVTALDINPIALSLIDLGGKIGVTGNLKVDISDSRNLPYPNNYFDRVCAISSIEHIPNDGDITTVKEMARVLKKSGKLVITVPFVNCPPKPYFERKYDNKTIKSRIIEPSGLHVETIEYFGESGFEFIYWWNKIPKYIKIPVMWLQHVPSKLFLSEISGEDKHKARDVCIVLKKEE